MLARIKTLHAGIFLAGSGLVSLLVSSGALALDLGEITLTSALNEPLQATIELDSLAGVDAAMITVALGDQVAYDQVDIARDPYLDSIQFVIEVDNENEGRIILTSPDNVTEPFLNLIITVTEPGGVTLKEYTLLVELPSNTQAPPPEPAPAIAGEAATAPPTDSSTESYTVTSGDTMYEIAASTRPDAGVSVQQMMVAIQRANPDAFIDNNINRLINGRVLRIPTLQDIRIIDEQAAIAQVNQQNSDLGGQPLAAGNTTTAGGAAATRDQLSVLTGEDGASLDGGSSDLARTIAALENELMLSEEGLDRARIENLELNNQLSSLQEQIDLLENIIAIEDERIAQLQSELTAQADATTQALASAQTAADALTDLNNQPASGLTGLLQNTVVMLGVGLALVLAFLGFLVYRRKQAVANAEELSFNPALDAAEPAVGDEDVEEKPGLLAGLLARFRRSEPEDDDDDDDDYQNEEETISARTETPAPAAPQIVTKAAKSSTGSLLDEMGISDDLMNLDDALDGIDSNHTDEAEVFAPVEDAEPAVAVVAVADTVEITAAEALAAIDDEVAEDVSVVEFESGAADTVVAVPEAFEFTFKDKAETTTAAPVADNKEEIETFDFKFSTPVAEKAADTIEVIAFPGSKPAVNDAVEVVDDDVLDLDDLSFEDTVVADDAEEESEYKPRTGNECDTKLDLATAYEAMGDVVEAIEILDEVIAEGSPSQIETAQLLKKTWQSA